MWIFRGKACLVTPFSYVEHTTMSFLTEFSLELDRQTPYPYNLPAIRHAQQLDVSAQVNFFVGENGTGKSTLLEALAFRFQLPHMDGSSYTKRCFQAAVTLAPLLSISYQRERTVGFFFRAEDFGDFINSVDRRDVTLQTQLDSLQGEVPQDIIQEIKDNANSQLYRMKRNYGQELVSFSHGEAYLKILEEKTQSAGIYLLDEPEAALSPAKQLSLIYYLKDHLHRFASQFFIATHSPILMAFPKATLYEITSDGMQKTPWEELEHIQLTKNFLNQPEMYLRHL